MKAICLLITPIVGTIRVMNMILTVCFRLKKEGVKGREKIGVGECASFLRRSMM